MIKVMTNHDLHEQFTTKAENKKEKKKDKKKEGFICYSNLLQ